MPNPLYILAVLNDITLRLDATQRLIDQGRQINVDDPNYWIMLASAQEIVNERRAQIQELMEAQALVN